MIAGLFPPYEPDWFLKVSSELCYCQHGGSGFSFSLADVRAMDVDEMTKRLEWLDERREAEANAIKKASKG